MTSQLTPQQFRLALARAGALRPAPPRVPSRQQPPPRRPQGTHPVEQEPVPQAGRSLGRLLHPPHPAHPATPARPQGTHPVEAEPYRPPPHDRKPPMGPKTDGVAPPPPGSAVGDLNRRAAAAIAAGAHDRMPTGPPRPSEGALHDELNRLNRSEGWPYHDDSARIANAVSAARGPGRSLGEPSRDRGRSLARMDDAKHGLALGLLLSALQAPPPKMPTPRARRPHPSHPRHPQHPQHPQHGRGRRVQGTLGFGRDVQGTIS